MTFKVIGCYSLFFLYWAFSVLLLLEPYKGAFIIYMFHKSLAYMLIFNRLSIIGLVGLSHRATEISLVLMARTPGTSRAE